MNALTSAATLLRVTDHVLTDRAHRPLRLAALGLSSLGAVALIAKIVVAVSAGPTPGRGSTPGLTIAFVTVIAVVAVSASLAIFLGSRAAVPLLIVAIFLTASLELFGDSPPPRFLALVPLTMALGLLLIARPRPGLDAAPAAELDGKLDSSPPGSGRTWSVVVALVLQALVAFPYLLSGLVAPTYGVIFLWTLWGAFLALTVYFVRRGSLLSLAVPAVAFGVWFLTLWAGSAGLGWTA